MSGAVHEGLVDHVVVDKAFRDVLDALEHPGASDLLARFHALDQRLRAHTAREDMDLAKFADVDAEDAKKLLADHASFRDTLDALGEQAKAGTLTAGDLRSFKVRVTLHEAHEETGLYRWLKPATA